jgi:hypothetical protein
MRKFFKLSLVLAAFALPLRGNAADIYFGETDVSGPGGHILTSGNFVELDEGAAHGLLFHQDVFIPEGDTQLNFHWYISWASGSSSPGYTIEDGWNAGVNPVPGGGLDGSALVLGTGSYFYQGVDMTGLGFYGDVSSDLSAFHGQTVSLFFQLNNGGLDSGPDAVLKLSSVELVPEPSSATLLLLGVLLIAWVRYHRRQIRQLACARIVLKSTRPAVRRRR